MPPAALSLLLLAGCQPDPCPPGSARAPATGLCTLLDEDGDPDGTEDPPQDDTAARDTGEPSPDDGLALTSGDPIALLAESGEPGGPGVELVEWVDATPVGPDHVVVSGQGGAQLHRLEDGALVGQKLQLPRTYRSAADGRDVVFGGRGGGLFQISFAAPENPTACP